MCMILIASDLKLRSARTTQGASPATYCENEESNSRLQYIEFPDMVFYLNFIVGNVIQSVEFKRENRIIGFL
jgi:hypothetical protein